MNVHEITWIIMALFSFLTTDPKRRIVGLRTQLRWFCREQKDQSECSSYFMHVCKDMLRAINDQSSHCIE
jgi:hypothetical protein